MPCTSHSCLAFCAYLHFQFQYYSLQKAFHCLRARTRQGHRGIISAEEMYLQLPSTKLVFAMHKVRKTKPWRSSPDFHIPLKRDWKNRVTLKIRTVSDIIWGASGRQRWCSSRTSSLVMQTATVTGAPTLSFDFVPSSKRELQSIGCL